MSKLVDWLLEGDAWVKYRTRLDILHQSMLDADVIQAHQEVVSHPAISQLVSELAGWPGSVISSHKSAGHPLHKLTFLADIGLKQADPGVAQIIERILEHQADTGPFQVLMNIPQHFGGTGKDVWAWALCDAPLVLYALIQFGLGEDARVQAAVSHLMSLVRENGFPCSVSPELGKFRGPGRKDDACPFATLVMLKVAALQSQWIDSDASRYGAEAILNQWQNRQTSHPYMFFMGTDFCKLKAPLVWFDIVHVVDVLTRFPWLKADPRLKEMVDIITQKGRFAGSLYTRIHLDAWKDWEFGQKKEPSRWLTMLVLRAIQHMEE